MLNFVTSQVFLAPFSLLPQPSADFGDSLDEFYVNIFPLPAFRGSYLHVISRTLFEGGFSLSLVNMEERLPLILEKSADIGRY